MKSIINLIQKSLEFCAAAAAYFPCFYNSWICLRFETFKNSLKVFIYINVSNRPWFGKKLKVRQDGTYIELYFANGNKLLYAIYKNIQFAKNFCKAGPKVDESKNYICTSIQSFCSRCF